MVRVGSRKKGPIPEFDIRILERAFHPFRTRVAINLRHTLVNLSLICNIFVVPQASIFTLRLPVSRRKAPRLGWSVLNFQRRWPVLVVLVPHVRFINQYTYSDYIMDKDGKSPLFAPRRKIKEINGSKQRCPS